MSDGPAALDDGGGGGGTGGGAGGVGGVAVEVDVALGVGAGLAGAFGSAGWPLQTPLARLPAPSVAASSAHPAKPSATSTPKHTTA